MQIPTTHSVEEVTVKVPPHHVYHFFRLDSSTGGLSMHDIIVFMIVLMAVIIALKM